MVRRQKTVKATGKRDRLSELPDGVHHIIISKLTLKEAVRTSLLSKCWRYIWNSHPHLLFNSINMLGSSEYPHSIGLQKPESNRRLQRCKFTERVDQIMCQRCVGSKMDSLAVHFHLGQDFASYINKWISSAVIKGVENVCLDFSEWLSSLVNLESSTTYEQYIFHTSILFPLSKDCTIKHLRLSSCSLISSIPCSNGLDSLVTIELQDVDISDNQMVNFLSISPSLERLSLDNCKGLVSLKFVGSDRLKLLSVRNCLRLMHIYICAEDLRTLDYTGQAVSFSFKRVPKLSEMFLNFTGLSRVDGVAYALSRLAYDLPQLETLNLVCALSLNIVNMPEDVPVFTNIKHFVLTIFPFKDEDELCWIIYVLKAFPLLQSLQLNLFSPEFIRQSKEINRRLSECHHSHLRELEVNGFYGNEHECMLLKYLLDNSVELLRLVINPCQKLYKGFYKWDYEEVSSWYDLSKESIAWLHGAVPQTVDLQIR